MSTKRLSRTVIEGGRYGFNKFERRQSHANERAASREYCKKAVLDPEYSEEVAETPTKPVYKEFSDKLSPMYSWLDAQVGRPWSDVRSEVFQTFDIRTTAGRHITFDHLLRSVTDTESGYNKSGVIVDPAIPKVSSDNKSYYYYGDYYVDQAGILRKTEKSYRKHRYLRISEEEYAWVAEWLAGRMIGEKGGRHYWIVPSEGIWKASWKDPDRTTFRLTYYILDNGVYEDKRYYKIRDEWFFDKVKTHGDFWNRVDAPFSFRQRGELTKEEVAIFRSLKKRIQEDILAFGSNRL